MSQATVRVSEPAGHWLYGDENAVILTEDFESGELELAYDRSEEVVDVGVVFGDNVHPAVAIPLSALLALLLKAGVATATVNKNEPREANTSGAPTDKE